MVRLAIVALWLCMAGPALAQAVDSPPAVNSEAPDLGALAAETDAVPQLPGPTAAPVAVPLPEATADAPVETDLLGLVLKSHWVVQAVMGLLALAVAAVLTVFLFKTVEFSLAFARLRRAGAGLAAGSGLLALPDDSPLAEAARAAHDEVAALPLALTADLRASARERLDLALDRIEARAVQRLRSGTGLLASIGAVAPFVGLFGTVFGIMNSFLAIAAAKTTSLVVVAPGIAEALLATGIGLAAAIPAVLLYNRIMRRIATFRHRMADGTAELLRRFSHEMDARMAPARTGV
jgi:biopolymer transport protein ExbB